eukprot:1643610-Pleurochrysis_carterae.AAC.1
MNSAKRTSVSLLYRAPPGADGSTNGVRSVDAKKSSNHSRVVAVRPTADASITLALAAIRRRATFARAPSE